MKLAKLYLKAYGAFTDHALDFDGESNFHVIYGANEAGKSTTLRALMGLLFGIDHNTADNFLHAHPQLRIGATFVANSAERISVMRRKGRKQTLFALDEQSGAELTDQPLSEDTLSKLLGGLDEGLYRSLFGLDIDGLAQGSEALLAGEGEIGQSLFEAAAGLASLQRLSNRLDQQASTLFRPKAHTSLIHVAIKELEEKRKIAREATVRTSAWEQAERARRQAEEKHATARSALTTMRDEHRLLSRIAANLPLAAERAAKLQELDTLGHVPLLPPDAAQQRIEAEERLRTAIETQRDAEAALAQLKLKRSALVVREPLLANAATIERLHHAAKDWRGAMERLPRIERDVESVNASIASRLANLSPDISVDQVRRLIPAPTLTARVQTLAEQFATLSANKEQLAESARAGESALDKLRHDLAGHPDQAPLDVLEKAREQATAQGDLTEQVSRLDREITAVESEVTRMAAVLWNGSLDDLATLRVPLAATLHEFEAEYRRLNDDLRTLRSKDDDLARDIRDRERELRGLEAAGEIATHEQVRAARLRRDEGWRLVRQGYVERSAQADRLADAFSPGASLPNAYEDAVREADRLADLLHADAERAANFETTRQRIGEMHESRALLERQRKALDGELEALHLRWTAVATSIGQSDLTPTAALEWRQQHATWSERYAHLDTLRQKRQEVTDSLAMARASLDQAFQACGLPSIVDAESLTIALARAKAAIDAARKAATARAGLIGSIGQQESELAKIRSQQARLTEKLEEWRNHWTEAAAALQLPADALPAEARARIEELNALAKDLDALDRLTREAAFERQTRSDFEQALSELASAVGESLAGKDADYLVSLLYKELEDAREADRSRKQTDAEIHRETERIQQARLAESSQRECLADLVGRAGVQSPSELPALEKDAARKRQLSDRIAEIDRQLASSAARPLADVLAEVEGHEIAATTARLAEIETEIKQQEALVDAAYGELLEAKRAFDAIDGGDAAARAQQESEELIARIARHAHAYARARLAQAVVSRVVQSYREKHQGPVLRRAGEIFARITLGSFSGLVTDYENDAQVLRGMRPDGAHVGVAGMSQGTLDQLYLALRIAAIEEHLKEREAIPLVIDDLLVQFDDARASATLSVLAELAERTQVLFFTHHGHVCELAAGVLEAGSWRRHELRAAVYGVASES